MTDTRPKACTLDMERRHLTPCWALLEEFGDPRQVLHSFDRINFKTHTSRTAGAFLGKRGARPKNGKMMVNFCPFCGAALHLLFAGPSIEAT
jgi:hypothetical protein